MLTQPSSSATSIVPLRYQLRWRLISMFVVLVVLPISVIQLITLLQTSSHAQRQVFNQLESVADLKQNQIDRWLADTREAFHLLLLNPVQPQLVAYVQAAQVDPATQTAMSAFLKEAIGIDKGGAAAGSQFRALSLYTADGRIVAASDDDLIGRVVTSQPYFAQSLRSDHIQPPYYAIGTETLMMIITHRLVDDHNQTVGVLAGELNLETLSAMVYGLS